MKIKICSIASVLVIGSVLFACATNKGISNNELKFNFTVEGVSEGIKVEFNNIPKETTDIVLVFVDINAEDKPETVVFINYNALDELKEKGYIICPFAENGREYFIRIYRHTDLEYERYFSGAVAGGGIYMTNNPSLDFTDGNYALRLSEMPTFSEEVVFAPDNFFVYYTFVRKADGHFIATGYESTNDLISTRSIQPNDDLDIDYSAVFSGNVPMFAISHCRLEHGNLEWLITIAQSKDTIVKF